MISPQTIIKPTSQIKLDDSPLMEVSAAMFFIVCMPLKVTDMMDSFNYFGVRVVFYFGSIRLRQSRSGTSGL